MGGGLVALGAMIEVDSVVCCVEIKGVRVTTRTYRAQRYEPSGLWVEFPYPTLTDHRTIDPVTGPVTDPVDLLLVAVGNALIAPSDLQNLLHLNHRPTFRANYLRPALEQGWVEMTLPEKPSSRLPNTGHPQLCPRLSRPSNKILLANPKKWTPAFFTRDCRPLLQPLPNWANCPK
jgi:hypothetical protein